MVIICIFFLVALVRFMLIQTGKLLIAGNQITNGSLSHLNDVKKHAWILQGKCKLPRGPKTKDLRMINSS